MAKIHEYDNKAWNTYKQMLTPILKITKDGGVKSVTVSDGIKNYSANDPLVVGNTYTITVVLKEGYDDLKLVLNSKAIANGHSFVLDDNAFVLSATTTDVMFDLAITATGCSVTVVDEDMVSYSAGADVLPVDKKLTISVVADEGYDNATLEVNGVAFTSGDEHLIAGNVTIVATAEDMLFDLAITATGCSVKVEDTITMDKYEVGENEIPKNAVVSITVTASEGYTLDELVLTANGVAIDNEDTITVTKDLTIVATAQEIEEEELIIYPLSAEQTYSEVWMDTSSSFTNSDFSEFAFEDMPNIDFLLGTMDDKSILVFKDEVNNSYGVATFFEHGVIKLIYATDVFEFDVDVILESGNPQIISASGEGWLLDNFTNPILTNAEINFVTDTALNGTMFGTTAIIPNPNSFLIETSNEYHEFEIDTLNLEIGKEYAVTWKINDGEEQITIGKTYNILAGDEVFVKMLGSRSLEGEPLSLNTDIDVVLMDTSQLTEPFTPSLTNWYAGFGVSNFTESYTVTIVKIEQDKNI